MHTPPSSGNQRSKTAATEERDNRDREGGEIKTKNMYTRQHMKLCEDTKGSNPAAGKQTFTSLVK